MTMPSEISSGWRTEYAQVWATTILRVLGTAYPYGAAHVSLSPNDNDVEPSLLHPAFHGSVDWHSSAHMQWSAIRLLTVAHEELEPETRADLIRVLQERLTEENGVVEAAYLLERPSYERPYGWAWAAMLAAAARSCSLPEATGWAKSTGIVADAVADNLMGWMPNLAYPVRHGVHSNTAFAVALCHEAFGALGRGDVVAAVEDNARRWFAGDQGYATRWEPSGNDFLSPALCEADLMRRVTAPDEYAGWLAGFLPHLAAEGDSLLEIPQVLDRTDGHLVHLFGLALSRAWLLRLLAPHLRDEARERVEAATVRQIAAVEREIVEGHFMSTHWLVSFALLAVTATET
ncbi:MAG: DUF2891 family protein [Actinomycetota bacterium]